MPLKCSDGILVRDVIQRLKQPGIIAHLAGMKERELRLVALDKRDLTEKQREQLECTREVFARLVEHFGCESIAMRKFLQRYESLGDIGSIANAIRSHSCDEAREACKAVCS